MPLLKITTPRFSLSYRQRLDCPRCGQLDNELFMDVIGQRTLADGNTPDRFVLATEGIAIHLLPCQCIAYEGTDLYSKFLAAFTEQCVGGEQDLKRQIIKMNSAAA